MNGEGRREIIGLGLGRWRGRPLALILLWGGILVNVGLILVFKLDADPGYPLGLSFLTFQVIAYWLEVQSGKVEREQNLLDFSFFLLLFPKIPVGPIVRYSQLRESVHAVRVDPMEAAAGLRRFILGLAKKVHRAGISRQESGQNPDGRGFSGAIGTQKSDNNVKIIGFGVRAA